jgi:hypothetical protein
MEELKDMLEKINIENDDLSDGDRVLIIRLGLIQFLSCRDHYMSTLVTRGNAKINVNYIKSGLSLEEEKRRGESLEILGRELEKEREKVLEINKKLLDVKTAGVQEIWVARNDAMKEVEENKQIELEEMRGKVKEANGQIGELNKELWTIRNKVIAEYNEKNTNEVEGHKDQIKSLNSQLEKCEIDRCKLREQSYNIVAFRDEYVKREVEIQMEEKNKELKEKEKRIKSLSDLYESAEKGVNWENELGPKFDERNTKVYGGKWDIKRVGQQFGGMGDFMFMNKGTGNKYMVDLKNNLAHNPVTNIDRDKFVKDIKNNEVNGGIMVAKNNITNKGLFERDSIGDKMGIYISKFSNIDLLFQTLELLEAMYIDEDNDIEKLGQIKTHMEEAYNKLTLRSKKMKKAEKELENELGCSRILYKSIFGGDIETVNCKVGMSKTVKSDIIIDYEELEKGRTIKGERSRYFVEWEVGGKKMLYYVGSNYAIKMKIQSLEKVKKKGRGQASMGNIETEKFSAN